MSSPDPRSRFQSNYRHYHRHRAGSPGSWETWIGETPHPKRGLSRILRNTVIFTIVVAAITVATVLLLRGG